MGLLTPREFTGAMASMIAASRLAVAAAGTLKLRIGTYTYHSLSIDDMAPEGRKTPAGIPAGVRV